MSQFDWIVTPREPTEEMIEAGREASYHMSVSRIYRAMISVAPIAPWKDPRIENESALIAKLTEALENSRKAVSKVLEDGGVDTDAWWDGLVESQHVSSAALSLAKSSGLSRAETAFQQENV